LLLLLKFASACQQRPCRLIKRTCCVLPAGLQIISNTTASDAALVAAAGAATPGLPAFLVTYFHSSHECYSLSDKDGLAFKCPRPVRKTAAPWPARVPQPLCLCLKRLVATLLPHTCRGD
jgi:hypothetical protein